MRKLHLVGLTTDHDGLIFTARKGSKSGGFIVPLDDKVLAAVAEARAADNGVQPDVDPDVPAGEAVPKRLRSESALTPREMQARLRGGRSIEEVAAEAGVDNEWVARFAVPILAEQAQVVELARSLVYAKPRLGESSQPLGASVLQNLSDRGVFLPDDVANAAWSAFQLHDSVWMVRFRYRSRGRDQEAHWEADVPSGRLRARNRQASDLGYIDADRWREAPAEEVLPEEVQDHPVAPRRTVRKVSEAEPMAKAVAAAKRRTAARPPATVRGAKAAPAAKVTKVAKASAAGRTTKATKSTKTTKAPVAGKGSARTASGRTPVRRRPTKAVPAAETGPAAGSGGVRLAVARVSTARVAASMASADREPWAAAVRRSPRSQAPGDGRRPVSRPVVVEPVRSSRRAEPASEGAFQPRPLPPPGQEPRAPRVRKVTIPRPSFNEDGTPAVSLPAARRPSPRQEPMPAERGKLRRLRPR